MKLEEKRKSSEEIFDGVAIHLYRDVVELPDGRDAVREVIRHPGAVCVLPVTDDGQVYFVRQFRYAFEKVTLEAPAGKLEKGEDILEAAKRELKEETGLTASKMTFIGDMYTTPALIDEVIHLYIAEGLCEGEQSLDDDEFINVEKMSLDEAVKLVTDGKIKDSKTQVIILRADRFFEEKGQKK